MAYIPPQKAFIDENVGVLSLTNFRPSSESLRVLDAICEALQTDKAFLVGRSLSDEFWGKETTEFNVHTDFYKAQRLWNEASRTKVGRDTPQEIFEHSHDLKIKDDKWTPLSIIKENNKKRGQALTLSFNNKTVNLKLLPNASSLTKCAEQSLTIMNAIAADAKGTVKAHPSFPDDMDNERYTIRARNPNQAIAEKKKLKNQGHFAGSFTTIMPQEYAEIMGIDLES